MLGYGPEARRRLEQRTLVAFALGTGNPEYFQALRDRDLFTDTDAREEQEMLATQVQLTADVGRDGEGGVAVSIGVDGPKHKEAMINAAIKSLGDRAGDDLKSISTDLVAALKERGYWLEAPTIADLAALIATGEGVVVGVDSGTKGPERAW
jgi:hypothetical protein